MTPSPQSRETQAQHDSVRQYLVEKNVAPLLESFMSQLVATRPDDALTYLKQWAMEAVARRDGERDAARENAPPTASNHPSSKEDDKKKGDEVAHSDKPLTSESSHSNPKPQLRSLDEVEESPSLVADVSTTHDVEIRDPLEVVSTSWDSLIRGHKLAPAVMSKFFQMLFVQKPLLRRTVFDAVTDVDATSEKVAPYIDRLFMNSLPDAELVDICCHVAVGKGLQDKHFASFLTAMHAAVGTTMGAEEWTPTRNVAWNFYLRELSIRIQNAVKSAEEVATMQADNQNDNDKELSMSGQEGTASSTAKKADEDLELTPPTSEDEAEVGQPSEGSLRSRSLEPAAAQAAVKESWGKLPSNGHNTAATTMVTLLLTQHPILRKTVLKDYTEEALAAIAGPYLAQLADGTFNPADVVKSTKLVDFVEDSGASRKHLDYVLTAVLGSLGAQMGTQWTAVSTAWRDVLTNHSRALGALLFGEQDAVNDGAEL